MDKIVKSIDKYVLPFSIKMNEQKHLSAIKNGFVKLMPLSLIGAFFVLINNVFLNFSEYSFFYQIGIRVSETTAANISEFQAIGNYALQGTLGMIALMVPFAIGGAMAKERNVDEFSAGLVSIGVFMTMMPALVNVDYSSITGLDPDVVSKLPETVAGYGTQYFGGTNVISGMLIGLVVGELYSFIVNKDIVIKLPNTVPPNVAKSFSAVIPGGIILTLAGALSWTLISSGTDFFEFINNLIAEPLANAGGLVAWVYIFFSAFLWFFGIHGGLALSALDSGVLGPLTLENIALFQQYGSVDAAKAAGENFHMWAKPMVDSYIYLGGTGATLGLLIAIFIASKREDHRTVAKLGLPSAIFQINEPVLFGLPIIMNPLFAIPFLIIQPILGITTTIAYNLGIIPPITNIAPWTMPVGLGAFFNTNGSIAAMLFAFVNLAIAVIVYLPFVISANNQKIIEYEKPEMTDEEILDSLKF